MKPPGGRRRRWPPPAPPRQCGKSLPDPRAARLVALLVRRGARPALPGRRSVPRSGDDGHVRLVFLLTNGNLRQTALERHRVANAELERLGPRTGRPRTEEQAAESDASLVSEWRNRCDKLWRGLRASVPSSDPYPSLPPRDASPVSISKDGYQNNDEDDPKPGRHSDPFLGKRADSTRNGWPAAGSNPRTPRADSPPLTVITGS